MRFNVQHAGQVLWRQRTMASWGYGDTDFRGDDADEMGDFLEFVDVEGTSGLHVLQVACGEQHTCVLLSNNRMKCFGRGADGRLGYEDIISRGDGPGEMGDSLPFVDVEGSSSETVVAIALGPFHTCALFSNNRFKCFGYNHFGQLGYGDTANRGDSSNEMGDNLEFVDVEDMSGAHVVKVTCGADHTCVLMSNNRVKCFGRSNYGQLGYEDTQTRGDGPNEMGSNLPFVDVEGSSELHVLDVESSRFKLAR